MLFPLAQSAAADANERAGVVAELVMLHLVPAVLAVAVRDSGTSDGPVRLVPAGACCLSAACLLAAPPGLLEFLCRVPWDSLTGVGAESRDMEGILKAAAKGSPETAPRRKALVNTPLEDAMLQVLLQFLAMPQVRPSLHRARIDRPSRTRDACPCDIPPLLPVSSQRHPPALYSSSYGAVQRPSKRGSPRPDPNRDPDSVPAGRALPAPCPRGSPDSAGASQRRALRRRRAPDPGGGSRAAGHGDAAPLCGDPGLTCGARPAADVGRGRHAHDCRRHAPARAATGVQVGGGVAPLRLQGPGRGLRGGGVRCGYLSPAASGPGERKSKLFLVMSV